MSLSDVAISGPILVSAGLALTAGAVSFASPCCVPLVPGYLAYLAGIVGADTPTVQTTDTTPRSGRWRVAGAALLFVLGFTAVFAAETITVLGVSDALLANEELLERLGGIVTIAMGLVFLGLIPGLRREARIHRVPRGGIASAPLLGAVYGFGWTPCLGPTLAGVIAVADATQIGPTTPRGILLVLAYCLGLGIPFILLALSLRSAVRAAGWLRRHTRVIQLAGGAMLLAVGILLVTGLWAEFVNWLRLPIVGFTTVL